MKEGKKVINTFHKQKARVESFVLVKEIQRFLTEIIGTFGLTICATVSTVALSLGLITFTGAALSTGLILTALIFALAQVSGGHFNPAVTWALFISFRLKFWRLPYYWLAQIIGALIAASFTYAIFDYDGNVGSTTPTGITNANAFFMETFTSTVFIIVILAVTKRLIVGANAALAVGFALAALSMFSWPFTGASMNPARSLAPAIINRGRPINTIWVYIVGPMLGGTLAAFIVFWLNAGRFEKPQKPGFVGGKALDRPGTTSRTDIESRPP